MNSGTVDGRTSSLPAQPPVCAVVRGPDRPLARTFQAAAVWGGSTRERRTQRTRSTARIVTEQAKAIVADHAGLDIDAALSKKWQFARDHDLRVVDVAHGLVDGTLDVR